MWLKWNGSFLIPITIRPTTGGHGLRAAEFSSFGQTAVANNGQGQSYNKIIIAHKYDACHSTMFVIWHHRGQVAEDQAYGMGFLFSPFKWLLPQLNCEYPQVIWHIASGCQAEVIGHPMRQPLWISPILSWIIRCARRVFNGWVLTIGNCLFADQGGQLRQSDQC